MTLAEKCDIYGMPTCPWCGKEDRVFVRVQGELVCRSPHFPRHRMGPIPGGRNEDIRTTARSGLGES